MLQIIEGDYNWATFPVPSEEEPAKRYLNSSLYCGFKSPLDFHAKEQTVHVVFKSGQWRTKHGFRATYIFSGHPGVYLPTPSKCGKKYGQMCCVSKTREAPKTHEGTLSKDLTFLNATTAEMENGQIYIDQLRGNIFVEVCR